MRFPPSPSNPAPKQYQCREFNAMVPSRNAVLTRRPPSHAWTSTPSKSCSKRRHPQTSSSSHPPSGHGSGLGPRPPLALSCTLQTSSCASEPIISITIAPQGDGAYHAGISAVFEDTYVPEPKLDKTLVHEIHGRPDVQGDRRLPGLSAELAPTPPSSPGNPPDRCTASSRSGRALRSHPCRCSSPDPSGTGSSDRLPADLARTRGPGRE